MTVPRARMPRVVAGAAALSLSLSLVVLGCTAGDELVYRGAATTASEAGTVDGGTALEDSGRIVGDSTVDVSERAPDGATFSTFAPIACTGLAPDCDPSEGKGCCLRDIGGNTGADNLCFEQAQHFGGTSCISAGDVFLACLASTADSTCCWQTEASGVASTRYRSACTGGIEACDPSAPGGGLCATGGACTAVTCKGVVVGYCGGGPAPCQP